MAKNSAASLLTSVDELFTTQEERDEAKSERIVKLPLDEISDFPNHPFKVRMDDCMMEMVESVKAHGVLVPAIVRPNPDGGYEMIAGHRRKLASNLAGQMEMDCIVRNLTDDEAIIIMVDSNLQRDQILPSEKAFAYKMKLDAMKRQGQRTDLTSDPLGQKLKGVVSVEQLAADAPDSKTQIQRFIRLTYLIPELLEMVDNSVLKDKEIKQIALRPAVELSYLSENEQRLVLDTIDLEDCTPSHAQAIQMRAASERGELTEETILSLMQQEKPNQKEQFRMPREKINRFFAPGTPAQKIEDTIIKALELYRKRQREQQR
ncbi:MAG: ParB/RepB/Spo0J family partition protein [Oscillospiraceae bacterium]|nr:ParB/RepB/Spo0J family partition protein [Oscillospiraceae bacterium]